MTTANIGIPGTLAAKPAVHPWFVNRQVDIGLVLVLGPLLSVILLCGISTHTGFLVAAGLFAMLSDTPHVLSTPVRVWMDPAERKLFGRHYVVSLAVTTALVCSLALTGHLLPLLVAWTYWQVVHVFKQHYGMTALYSAKSRYDGNKKLLKYTLWSGCAAPVLYRASHGLRFNHYVLFGHKLPFSDLSVPVPPIPGVIVIAAYLVFAGFAIALGRELLSRRSSGKSGLPPMVTATVFTAIVSYNISYLLVKDLYALILIATTVHSLQYHLITWARHNGHFRHSAPEQAKLLLARLTRPRALPAYILGLGVFGVLISSTEPMAVGVIPLTLIFHHFYMDGLMWKAPRNPTLAIDLGVAKPKPAQAPVPATAAPA
jgi:hypothetical protein